MTPDANADCHDRRDVKVALDGDDNAYERIVRRHQDGVAARMWRFTRDRGVLEELVHDVFVEAYLSLSGYDGRAPFEHWLARIATRVGYRFWKRQRRRREANEVSIQDWDGPAPAESGAPGEVAEFAHNMLARLAPRDRLVLTLLYMEGRSVEEAAALAGWSKTMVKVQAHRARRKLRGLLEKILPEEEVRTWTR